METGGLRERKRRQTRDAVLEAAAEVFAARGYDAATIEEIAERVGISPRTVFRYFDGKDQIALAWLDDFYADLRGALAGRPAAEPPLEALVAAAGAAWDAISDGEPEEYGRWLALVDGSPALLSAVLRRADQEETRLAEEVARREGRSPDDLEVRVVVATFSALVRTASERWRAGDEPLVPALERTLRECVAHLRARLG